MIPERESWEYRLANDRADKINAINGKQGNTPLVPSSPSQSVACSSHLYKTYTRVSKNTGLTNWKSLSSPADIHVEMQ